METTQSERVDSCDCLVPTTRSMSGSAHGLLKGMSFVAKDLFDIEGHTPSFGHAKWRDTHSPATRTAPAMRALLGEGANLVGVTKMDQLAYSLIGDVGEGRPPVNSADPSLFCGGSSSGSAAAVASGMADFALGTDTAGSVRVPTAACGVFGIRPTHGSISSDGVVPLAPSFDVVGVLAKSASTLRMAMNVLARDLVDFHGKVSVHFPTDIAATVDDETAHAAGELAERLADITEGPLEEIEFRSFTDPQVGDLFARLQSREIWSHHAEWVTSHGTELAADVRGRLERCRELSNDPTSVREADLAERQVYCDRFDDAVPKGTIVVLPTLPAHGPKKSWTPEQLIEFRTACFRLTAPSSLRGAPQVVWSVRTPTGRSIGLSLLTAPGHDRLLLDLMVKLGEA